MPNAEVIVTDGQGDASKQDADVDDLIAQGIDVLLLTPLTADELTPAAERALDAGIPVITMDRAVNDPGDPAHRRRQQADRRDGRPVHRRDDPRRRGRQRPRDPGRPRAPRPRPTATTTFVAWLEANAPNVEIVEQPDRRVSPGERR